jgi:hypothetical protein
MTEDTRRGVRRTTAADRGALAGVLAAAFADDPVFAHLFPAAVSRRESRLRRMFALEAARSEQYGGTWITGDGSGAAVWFPPGRWKATTWEDLRDLPRWVALFGRESGLGRQAQTVRKEMEAHHRELPAHWYLLYLGVVPGRQGEGLGGALLRPTKDPVLPTPRKLGAGPGTGPTAPCTRGTGSPTATRCRCPAAGRRCSPCGGIPPEHCLARWRRGEDECGGAAVAAGRGRGRGGGAARPHGRAVLGEEGRRRLVDPEG